MKKLLFVILFLPLFSFSQKIISDRNEIKELKDEVQHYTKVIIENAGFSINVLIGIDAGGIWHFYDTEADKDKKFKTDAEVFNFMYINGWLLKEELNTTGSMKAYLFEKKQL